MVDGILIIQFCVTGKSYFSTVAVHAFLSFLHLVITDLLSFDSKPLGWFSVFCT
jgi:hypothetical protein